MYIYVLEFIIVILSLLVDLTYLELDLLSLLDLGALSITFIYILFAIDNNAAVTQIMKWQP